MIYGVDVSAYQPNFDFAACAREGFDFAFIKATEGVGWRSAYFNDNPNTGAKGQLRKAREAGLLVAAYHYVNGSDVGGQLANIKAMVSADTPVILDVEAGAGSIASIRALNAALNEAGYRTPLIYIPRWYWRDHMGSPDLSGLPPNWHSAYPDNVVRRKEAFVDYRPNGPDLRPTFPSFGGISTEVSQFTSSLAVANYPGGRIDGNAYRGTREQLAALLGGQEDDMQLSDRMENAWGGTPTLEEVFRYIDLRTAEAAEAGAAANTKLDALLGRQQGDVDERELAKELLAQGLGSQLGRMPKEQFDQLVKAVNDENDRRERVRANTPVPRDSTQDGGQ